MLFQGIGVIVLSYVMICYFPSVVFFFLMIVLRVVITISCRSWMMAWVGIELNMLSFLPIITLIGVGSHYAEAAGKYFLAQAAGTTIFLFSPVLWTMVGRPVSIAFIMGGMILKMGAAPFHQ